MISWLFFERKKERNRKLRKLIDFIIPDIHYNGTISFKHRFFSSFKNPHMSDEFS
jgi:hypothetical protein